MIEVTRWIGSGHVMRLYPGSLKIDSKRFKIDAGFAHALTSAVEAIEQNESQEHIVSDPITLKREPRGYSIGEGETRVSYSRLSAI